MGQLRTKFDDSIFCEPHTGEHVGRQARRRAARDAERKRRELAAEERRQAAAAKPGKRRKLRHQTAEPFGRALYLLVEKRRSVAYVAELVYGSDAPRVLEVLERAAVSGKAADDDDEHELEHTHSAAHDVDEARRARHELEIRLELDDDHAHELAAIGGRLERAAVELTTIAAELERVELPVPPPKARRRRRPRRLRATPLRRGEETKRSMLELGLRLLNEFRPHGSQWRAGKSACLGKQHVRSERVTEDGEWIEDRVYCRARRAGGMSARMRKSPRTLWRYLAAYHAGGLFDSEQPPVNARDAERPRKGDFAYTQIWWQGALPPTVLHALRSFHGGPSLHSGRRTSPTASGGMVPLGRAAAPVERDTGPPHDPAAYEHRMGWHDHGPELADAARSVVQRLRPCAAE